MSSVGFFNPATGKFTCGASTGSGFFYRFYPEGYFEHGGLMRQSFSGCTTEFFLYEVGTVAAQGNTLVLYRQKGLTETDGNCGHRPSRRNLGASAVGHGWAIEGERLVLWGRMVRPRPLDRSAISFGSGDLGHPEVESPLAQPSCDAPQGDAPSEK